MNGRPFPWRAALFASLAVNLLLLGGMAGGYAAGLRLDRPHAAERPSGSRGAFLRALPPGQRDAMRADLRRTWRATRELREKSRAVREEVRRLGSAEPYDRAQMSAAFADMRAADAAVQAAWHDSMAQSLSRLSADERRAAIDAFIKEWGRPPGRHGPRKEGNRTVGQ
jgi:uncharacterized membrane protein